jgi:DsbC/DsbD-like thiol-disulfide interchange protein
MLSQFVKQTLMTTVGILLQRAAPLLALLASGAFVGAALGAPGLAASKGQSPWTDQINSKVRIISGTLQRDGTPQLYAGVQLRMDPGWKTYWRNPGDSGVPPTFDWSGSKNVRSAEVLYPTPHRFADANGTAIGYEDEVVFPVKITPERAGEPVALSLTFEYGLCKDLCIPNSVELRAQIPADLGKGDAWLIDQAYARVPEPAGPDTLPRLEGVTATLDGPAPGLEVAAMFPDGATGTDLFIASPDVLIPVPKALGPLQDGKQRFAVAFATPDEAAAVRGKPLTFTLVSNEGASETTRTED